MKLCCPACGSVFSLDVLLASESARGAVMSALELPAPLGKLLIQYIALFRPAQRQLSFDRVARLLEELRQPISDAKIERNGRLWPAPLDTWRAAITEMLALRDTQKLRLPLLSAQLSVPTRALRTLISELRSEGMPICGHPTTGYYIAETAAELQSTCDFLRSRALHSLVLESRLRKCSLAQLIGQLQLELDSQPTEVTV